MASINDNGRLEKEIIKTPETASSTKVDTASIDIDHVAEKKLVRKLDLFIIPVVMLLYLLSFLDRLVQFQLSS